MTVRFKKTEKGEVAILPRKEYEALVAKAREADEGLGTARLIARGRKEIAAGASLIPMAVADRPWSSSPGSSRRSRSGENSAIPSAMAGTSPAMYPAAVTASAPAMTKASVGSQRRTYRGSPAPWRAASCRRRAGPHRRSIRSRSLRAHASLAPEAVPHDRDHDYGGRHEDRGRDDRARRQPRDPAHAVAGGAAAAKPRAEADQQSSDDDHEPACGNSRHRQRPAEHSARKRRGDQAGDEGEPPEPIAGAKRQQLHPGCR